MVESNKKGYIITRTFKVRRKFDDLFICGNHLIWARHENMEGYIVYQEFEDLLQENQYMTPAQFEKYKKYTNKI